MATDAGKVLIGQRYDEQGDIVVGYTETMKNGSNVAEDAGNARTDIIPNDGHSAKVRVWEQPSVSSVYLRFPGTTNINLPDVLESVTITYNKSAGTGDSSREVGEVAWVGESGGMNMNPSSNASGSGAIIPDAQIEISEGARLGNNVPTDNFYFYVAGNVTLASILSRLQTILTLTVSSVVAGLVTTSAAHGLSVNEPFTFLTLVGGAGGIATATTYYVKTVDSTTTFTYASTAGGAALSGHSATSGTMAPSVSAWPRFKPKAHTLTLKGEQKSVRVDAEASFTYRWSSDGSVSYAYSPAPASSPTTRSDGISYEAGVTVRSVRIPPTIHGAVAFTGSTSDTQTFSATAEAVIPEVTESGGAPSFAGTEITKASGTITVTGSVSPTSLSATSGLTAIPTAGLYILDTFAEPYRYGLNRVRVTLVNFNAFA